MASSHVVNSLPFLTVRNAGIADPGTVEKIWHVRSTSRGLGASLCQTWGKTWGKSVSG